MRDGHRCKHHQHHHHLPSCQPLQASVAPLTSKSTGSTSTLSSQTTSTPSRPWERHHRSLLVHTFASSLLLGHVAHAIPTAPVFKRGDENKLSVRDTTSPAPSSSVTTYLPAQIGGIIGSYAVCLVLVALTLLLLSKRRREHLNAGDSDAEFAQNVNKPQQEATSAPEPKTPLPPQSPRSIPRSPVILNPEFHPPSATDSPSDRTPYIFPSPTSTTRSPLGADPTVDQRIVAADREMAQSHLEDMYKYVMEHEEAKLKGVDAPPVPIPAGGGGDSAPRAPNVSSAAPESVSSSSKKGKLKPAHLNLSQPPPREEKRQSKASALFSALRSPKKKVKGLNISSPIMTPMSGTFPRESQEMNTIPPRQYAPPPPPPIPLDQAPFTTNGSGSNGGQVVTITPDLSPDGSQSIDERLSRLPIDARGSHSRSASGAPTEGEPESAISENSQTPLVGLPQSPKPGANRFPTLPASPRASKVSTAPPPLSPKVNTHLNRPNPPSAVRTGGALPLRAYESAMSSPTASSVQTKQTVFERMGPLSPMGGRTPFTGTAVPYSPYQPFTPCVPITPTLVTKADRKRMKRLEPKTPTLQMVKSTEDMW